MQRVVQPEQMDEPTLPVDQHHLALDGLRRLNRASGIVDQLLKPLLAFTGKRLNRSHGGTITLLDIAAGGGDVPVALATAARASGVDIRLTLFDRSEAALAKAAQTADRAGVNVTLIRGNVVDDGLPMSADVVTCSLFLHHLSEIETITVLTRLRKATDGLLLISDLRRCVAGVVAAHVACRTLTQSAIVRFDGPVSARAAWTIPELQTMTHAAGMPDAQIRSVWPFRQLLTWEKSPA